MMQFVSWSTLPPSLMALLLLPLIWLPAEPIRPVHLLQLETTQQWREAAEGYEAYARSEPHNHAFWLSHARRCRIQYRLSQIARSPVSGAFDGPSFPAAIDHYAELLRLLQEHAVDAHSAATFWHAGLNLCELALDNPAFVQHLFRTNAEPQIGKLKAELKQWRSQPNPADATQAANYLRRAATTWQQRFNCNPATVVFLFCHASCTAVDAWSGYLPPFWFKREMAALDRETASPGLLLAERQEGMYVQAVVAGSNAESRGIFANAQVVTIDDQPAATLSLEEAELLLLGPAGSTVQIEIRGALEERAARYILVRDSLPPASVCNARMLAPAEGIGYVQILFFDADTARLLDAELVKLRAAGLQTLILDLRGNPGGLLTSAAEVGGRFLPSGVTIFSTHGRLNSQRREFRTLAISESAALPLVVLVDHETASAAEALAAALEELDGAITVGEATHGKSRVQHLLPIRNSGAGVRLSTSKWSTSQGTDLGGHGLVPQVQVPDLLKPMEHSHASMTQLQIETAIELARRLAVPPQFGGREFP